MLWKIPITQHFQKYAQTRRNFCQSSNFLVWDFRFWKSFERGARTLFAQFCLLCNFMSSFTNLCPQKWPPRQKFLTSKIIFLLMPHTLSNNTELDSALHRMFFFRGGGGRRGAYLPSSDIIKNIVFFFIK